MSIIWHTAADRVAPDAQLTGPAGGWNPPLGSAGQGKATVLQTDWFMAATRFTHPGRWRGEGGIAN